MRSLRRQAPWQKPPVFEGFRGFPGVRPAASETDKHTLTVSL